MDLEGSGRGLIEVSYRNMSEGTEKPSKDLNQDSGGPGQDSNRNTYRMQI
jgi:hypothetical protein